MKGHDCPIAGFWLIQDDVTASGVILDKPEGFEPLDELFRREGREPRYMRVPLPVRRG